jgi:hypothetical protein
MSDARPRDWDALALAPDDDVGVALRDLDRDAVVRVRVDGGIVEVVSGDPIPLGHKTALRSVAVGELVRKYGQPIGRATGPIALGSHVHVHNLKSVRGSRRAMASSS